MPDETLTLTPKGISAIASADTLLETLDVHCLVACIGTPQTMLNIVNVIRTNNSELRFIDPKFVANSVAKLVRAGMLQYHVPAVQLSRRDRRALRYNYAR